MTAELEPVAHIVTKPDGKRSVTLATQYDPMASSFWLGGTRPEGYSVDPLVTLSSAQEAIDKREERIRELERERDAFRGVLEGAEYGDIEGIAKYDADKARALGRMIGNLSKGIRIQVTAAEARVKELEAMLQQTVEETSEEIAKLMVRASALQALLDEVGEGLEDIATGRGRCSECGEKAEMPSNCVGCNIEGRRCNWSPSDYRADARSIAAKIKEAKG